MNLIFSILTLPINFKGDSLLIFIFEDSSLEDKFKLSE